jgi:hypothetical protein
MAAHAAAAIAGDVRVVNIDRLEILHRIPFAPRRKPPFRCRADPQKEEAPPVDRAAAAMIPMAMAHNQ